MLAGRLGSTQDASCAGRSGLSEIPPPPARSGSAAAARHAGAGQLQKRLRLMHHRLRTEKTSVHWVKALIRFHRLRHPAEMGEPKVDWPPAAPPTPVRCPQRRRGARWCA